MLGVLLVAENCARIKGAGKMKRTENIKIGKLRKVYSNTNSVRYELNSQYREKENCVRVCGTDERYTKWSESELHKWQIRNHIGVFGCCFLSVCEQPNHFQLRIVFVFCEWDILFPLHFACQMNIYDFKISFRTLLPYMVNKYIYLRCVGVFLIFWLCSLSIPDKRI